MLDPGSLFEFVGIVIPISFVGFRILLDEIDDISGMPDTASMRAYMNHVLAMVGFLVVAGWLAVLELLVSPETIPLVEFGYVSATVGITVPVWLLLTLRGAFEAADVAESS
jgi:hypothetical protein